MRRFFPALFFSVFFIISVYTYSFAQDKKIVSGVVKNFQGETIRDMVIYAFDTEALGDDANKLFEKNTSSFFTPPGLVTTAYPDVLSGYYEIPVAQTGAILYCTANHNGKLEYVRGRMEINVKIDDGEVLDPAKKIENIGGNRPFIEKPPKPNGKFMTYPIACPFPDEFSKQDMRLIVQSCVVDSTFVDTLDIVSPVVYDGTQYSLTQLRRMGYNKNADPLFLLAHPVPLDSLKNNVIEWEDTVLMNFTNEKNYLKWTLWIEDYNKVRYSRSEIRRVDRICQAQNFFDYSFNQYELDPDAYKRRPRREMRDNSASISLSFLVGKAQLDPTDIASVTSLENIKKELNDVVKGEGSTLKEFHIIGVASPDGPYAKNVDLANRRMNYALDQITSVLPKYVRDRVYMTKKASVAKWTDVSELLYADSLVSEAEEVLKIAEKYHDSMDQQWAHIRMLPYYKSKISPLLPKLRSVKYEYKNEIYRELTPEEILKRYRMDEDYRNGRKEFALYEYGHLFNLLEGEEELEDIYKRAYAASIKAEGRVWELPANNLAILYLKKGIIDTTILAPLINPNCGRCDQRITDMNGKFAYVENPAAIVANQVMMLLKDKKYARASELSDILPDFPESFTFLKAISWVLAGYAEDGDKGKQYYDIVGGENASPRNRVVMNIYRGDVFRASTEIDSLSVDDPVTKYLKTEIRCNSKDIFPGSDEYLDALQDLVACFKADSKYIGIADKDYLIGEKFYKEALEAYKDPTIMENLILDAMWGL